MSGGDVRREREGVARQLYKSSQLGHLPVELSGCAVCVCVCVCAQCVHMYIDNTHTILRVCMYIVFDNTHTPIYMHIQTTENRAYIICTLTVCLYDAFLYVPDMHEEIAHSCHLE